jgi:deoxyribodipyrimidine photo-lyase
MAKRALCWFRRDLRLHDHAPLAEATALAKQCAVAFIFDDNILGPLSQQDRRITFIHHSLSELDEKLRAQGSTLIVRRGDPLQEIPKLARELKADLVVCGRDYEPATMARDRNVERELELLGIEFRSVKDIVAMEPCDLKPFKVFTPYANAWRDRFSIARDAAEHAPDFSKLILKEQLPASIDWSFAALEFEEVPIWLKAGEDAGKTRLGEFLEKIGDYETGRDFPADDGTSKLSVDLRFGTISVREALRAASQCKGAGAQKWIRELIWREFYQSVLFHFPQVVDEPFQAQYRDLKWPGSEDQWSHWRDGKTGYPIVDAAMRCINQTGYMHNRLRMVTASFLTKDQLVDYRKGEDWFAQQLLDFELASNNGGWQWAASVGCDPQPYFRIFNPILQSRKFDPDGTFIRRWIPELASMSNDAIHAPWEAGPMELVEAGVELGVIYPAPCVDHSEQRKRAIALLGSAKIQK